MSLDSAMAKILNREGSTRILAILRILMVFLIWTKYAQAIRPAPDLTVGEWVIYANVYLATVFSLVGWYARASTAWLALGLWGVYLYPGAILGNQWFTSHHAYLLAWVVTLLAASPCGRSLSVDRWLAVKAAREAGVAPPPEIGPLWMQTLIGVKLCTVYFWGGIDKLNWAFLSGVRLEHHMRWWLLGSGPLPVGLAELLMIGAIGVTVFEFVLPVALWVRRWHWWLFPVGITFHAALYVGWGVCIFSLLSTVLYLVFIDPDQFHEDMNLLLGLPVDT